MSGLSGKWYQPPAACSFTSSFTADPRPGPAISIRNMLSDFKSQFIAVLHLHSNLEEMKAGKEPLVTAAIHPNPRCFTVS